MALRGRNRRSLRRSRFARYRHPFTILLIGLSFGSGSFLRVGIGTRTSTAVASCEARGGIRRGAGSDYDWGCTLKLGFLKERKRQPIKQFANECNVKGARTSLDNLPRSSFWKT